MGYYDDKTFRYGEDPKVLTYDQLLEKLQQVFEEAGFTYGLEVLASDPAWCVSELEQSRNIELIEDEEADEE